MNNAHTYCDTPPEKQWFLSFKTLFIPREHRRILNRQPGFKEVIRNQMIIEECAFGDVFIPFMRFDFWDINKFEISN
jgi:hypothetical protein